MAGVLSTARHLGEREGGEAQRSQVFAEGAAGGRGVVGGNAVRQPVRALHQPRYHRLALRAQSAPLSRASTLGLGLVDHTKPARDERWQPRWAGWLASRQARSFGQLGLGVVPALSERIEPLPAVALLLQAGGAVDLLGVDPLLQQLAHTRAYLAAALVPCDHHRRHLTLAQREHLRLPLLPPRQQATHTLAEAGARHRAARVPRDERRGRLGQQPRLTLAPRRDARRQLIAEQHLVGAARLHLLAQRRAHLLRAASRVALAPRLDERAEALEKLPPRRATFLVAPRHRADHADCVIERALPPPLDYLMLERIAQCLSLQMAALVGVHDGRRRLDGSASHQGALCELPLHLPPQLRAHRRPLLSTRSHGSNLHV